MVGDFRAALGAEFLCHFGEVIELHDLAKLLCKIWGRTGQTNPKRCRKSGDFSRIPPCEICENPYCREASVSWGWQKGCRVPLPRIRAVSRSRRKRSGLPSRSCGHGKACKEPASWRVATMGMMWSTTVAGVSLPCWRQRTQNGWCSKKDLLAVCLRFV